MPSPSCEDAGKVQPYTLDHVNHERIRSKVLLTNRYGCHAFLSQEEFRDFLRQRMDAQLLDRLDAAGVVLTERNTDRIIEMQRRKHQCLFQGTSLHIVVPTLRCNHSCVYCHASSKHQDAQGYDMSQETAEKTVDFILQSPSPSISIEFQGGEPLLNLPIVKFVIADARRKNLQTGKSLRFSIVTNLTLMTEEILDFLIREKVGICTSVDSPKEVHDENRKYLDGRGSYEDVVRWARVINHADPILLNALSVVTRHSLPHPERMVDDMVDLGFTRIWFKPMNYLGFAAHTWEKVGYPPEQYVSFYKRAIDHIVRQNKPIRDVFTSILLVKILHQKEPNYLDLQSPCGAAIGQLAYDYDGSVYSCDEGRMVPDGIFRLGNVGQSYREVLTSPETMGLVQASINDVTLCDQCAFKPYCGLCPVCNYASQGTMIPKLALDGRCLILKETFRYLFDSLEFSPQHRKVFRQWAEDVVSLM